MKGIGFLILFSVFPFAFAHEGHDHDAPAVAQAVKGGIVKELEKTRIEVVNQGKALKIYLFDREAEASTPLKVQGYKVSAKAEHPRTKKQEEVVLKPMDTFFEAQYDVKGLHRYTLLLTVVDPRTGHNDKVSFVIEPGK